LRTPALEPEAFLDGPSAWRLGPTLLVRVPAPDPAGEAPLVQSLLAAVPEARRHALVRRAPTYAAAVAAVADRVAAAVGADAGRSRLVRESPIGARLALATPREDLGRILLGTLPRVATARGAARERALAAAVEELVLAWESHGLGQLAAAARRRGVPVSWVAPEEKGLFLGEGARSRLWCEAAGGAAAGIRSALRGKLFGARVLERAGVPTATPLSVASAAEAIAAAQRLGFPVVVKPNCSSLQIGVTTRVATPEALRAAFRRAAADAGPLSGPVLVERQKSGRYLRATLVGGRVSAVVGSEAPLARGDGARSAEALARSALGLDPRARMGARDRSALDAVLASQGLARRSVVPRGRAFRVGHENEGPTEDMSRKVHPTLVALLERIGRVLPLPVLGVDLLVERPAAPATEANCAVIEVNTQPDVGCHERPARGPARDVFGPIVRHHFPRGAADARVEVTAGGPGTAPELERLAARSRARGIVPAGYTRGRAWVGEPRRGGIGEGGRAAALLRTHPRAEAIFLEVDTELAWEHGLPVDHVDRVVGSVGASAEARLVRALA
jgi:cyanophycin synthetase